MNEFEPGEKIEVRDGDNGVWVCRYYIAMNPFNNKIVTVDKLNQFESWFRFRKIKSNDIKTSQERRRS